jgi:hypothetical protein
LPSAYIVPILLLFSKRHLCISTSWKNSFHFMTQKDQNFRYRVIRTGPKSPTLPNFSKNIVFWEILIETEKKFLYFVKFLANLKMVTITRVVFLKMMVCQFLYNEGFFCIESVMPLFSKIRPAWILEKNTTANSEKCPYISVSIGW